MQFILLEQLIETIGWKYLNGKPANAISYCICGRSIWTNWYERIK